MIPGPPTPSLPQQRVELILVEAVQLWQVYVPVESVQFVLLTFLHVPPKFAVLVFTAKEYGHELG